MGEQFSMGQVITYLIIAICGTGGAIAGVWEVIKRRSDSRIKQAELKQAAELEEKKQKLQAEMEEERARLKQSELELAARLEEERQKTQAKLEDERQRLQAEIEGARDKREYEQRQSELAQAYQQSESSVAQQQLAGLLENAHSFIQERVVKSQDEVKETLTRIDGRSEHLAKEFERLVQASTILKKEYENLRGDFRTLLGIVEEVYDNWKLYQSHLNRARTPGDKNKEVYESWGHHQSQSTSEDA